MAEKKAYISCGYGSFISRERLIAVVMPDAAPIRRLIQEARERGTLIDATAGRKTLAVIIMDTDQVILSALPPEKLIRDGESEETDHAY